MSRTDRMPRIQWPLRPGDYDFTCTNGHQANVHVEPDQRIYRRCPVCGAKATARHSRAALKAYPPLVASLSYSTIVGRVIRMRRELAGISLQKMSSELGFKSSSGWSRTETGDTELTVVTLRKAARVLGVSPASLLQAADELAEELLRASSELRAVLKLPDNR